MVDWAAPAHYRKPEAERLLDLAKSGEIQMHLPSVCLAEARRPVLKKHQASHADPLRAFLRWGRRNETIGAADEEAVKRVLSLMEENVRQDVDLLNSRLAGLREEPGVEVFNLTEAILERAAGSSLQNLDLQLFDQVILAAILTRAEELVLLGERELVFCELDSDLQPWGKQGNPKENLRSLYDRAGVWVYEDFVLRRPAMPENWRSQG